MDSIFPLFVDEGSYHQTQVNQSKLCILSEINT